MTEDSSLEPLAPEDVLRGLAHMDVLIERIALARGSRLVGARVIAPRNAAERHVLETGHQLRFGCCRPTVDTAA